MRYTLSLEGDTGEPDQVNPTVTFPVDLKTLIPKSPETKFILRSTFFMEDCGALELSYIEVGLDFAKSYNKSYPEKQYTTIGFAKALLINHDDTANAKFAYSYSESDCVPIYTNYPDLFPLKIYLRSTDLIPEKTKFNVILAFEPI